MLNFIESILNANSVKMLYFIEFCSRKVVTFKY